MAARPARCLPLASTLFASPTNLPPRCFPSRLPQDGLEMTWAVNVAAPFLLTACLLEAVKERVVVVSSISAASSIDWGNLQQARGRAVWGDLQQARHADVWGNLQRSEQARHIWKDAQHRGCHSAPLTLRCTSNAPLLPERLAALAMPSAIPVLSCPSDAPLLPQERGYSAHNAYSLSKLAEQLFTFELADRLRAAGSQVTCNCLDPGEQRGVGSTGHGQSLAACCCGCCCCCWPGGCAAAQQHRPPGTQHWHPCPSWQNSTAWAAAPSCSPAPGTVNTKMLSAGWGSIGIPIKVHSQLVQDFAWTGGRLGGCSCCWRPVNV